MCIVTEIMGIYLAVKTVIIELHHQYLITSDCGGFIISKYKLYQVNCTVLALIIYDLSLALNFVYDMVKRFCGTMRPKRKLFICCLKTLVPIEVNGCTCSDASSRDGTIFWPFDAPETSVHFLILLISLLTSRKSRCSLTFCSCDLISSFWDELRLSSNSLILFVNS